MAVGAPLCQRADTKPERAMGAAFSYRTREKLLTYAVIRLVSGGLKFSLSFSGFEITSPKGGLIFDLAPFLTP